MKRVLLIATGGTIASSELAEMNPSQMIKIAQAIYDNYEKYDGLVVTGFQIAIEALYTDARKNISDAIRFANEDIAGIFMAFNGKIKWNAGNQTENQQFGCV